MKKYKEETSFIWKVLHGTIQRQLQIWTEHSTLIFENLKQVERSKIILASFEHLQKLYWLIFYFSTSFRFSKISVECSVHICSCPWVGSLIQRHSTHPLLTMKSCFYCYISRLWVPSEFISLSHLTHATQRNDWLFTLTLFPFPGQAYYSWSTKDFSSREVCTVVIT